MALRGGNAPGQPQREPFVSEFLITAHRGGNRFPSEQVDLPDLDAARREAVRYAGELLGDEDADFAVSEDWTITVADRTGLTLFTVTMLWTGAPALKRAH